MMETGIIEHQVEQLRLGGYRAEADTIEQLARTMNLRIEHGYLVLFASDNCFYDQHPKEQLRALWTAFCFHARWEADTQLYDNTLAELWELVNGKGWDDFDSFDNFMCEFLA